MSLKRCGVLAHRGRVFVRCGMTFCRLWRHQARAPHSFPLHFLSPDRLNAAIAGQAYCAYYPAPGAEMATFALTAGFWFDLAVCSHSLPLSLSLRRGGAKLASLPHSVSYTPLPSVRSILLLLLLPKRPANFSLLHGHLLQTEMPAHMRDFLCATLRLLFSPVVWVSTGDRDAGFPDVCLRAALSPAGR